MRNDNDFTSTMLIINMAAVSVYRILDTENRTVLKQEYDNVMNNIDFRNLRFDDELMRFFREFMEVIEKKKLRQEELKRFHESDMKHERELISTILKNVPEHSGSLWGWLGKFALSCLSSYLDYQDHQEEILDAMNEHLWHMKAEDILDCCKLKSSLLTVSWKLIDKYKLSRETWLRENHIRTLCSIISDPNPYTRLISLKNLEGNFHTYPPYWYFCMRAAQELSREHEAQEYIVRFDEVWHPVLIKDPYKLETTKCKILFLMKNGGCKSEIIKLLEVMTEHNPIEHPDSWLNNLFIGITYFTLGEKNRGIACVKVNLNREYETEVSRAVMLQMKMGEVVPKKLQEVIDTYNQLHKLTNDTSSNNSEVLYTLGCIYFAGDKIDYEKAANFFHKAALRGHKQAQFWTAIVHIYGLGRTTNYTEAIKWLEESAKQGHKKAQIILSIMYRFGLWTEKNDSRAIMWLQRIIDADKPDIMSKTNSEMTEAERQYKLGEMYFTGHGARKDLRMAIRFFSQSAELGYMHAQFKLGIIYMHGIEETQNYKEALRLFKQAAEQGHTVARLILEIYQLGLEKAT